MNNVDVEVRSGFVNGQKTHGVKTGTAGYYSYDVTQVNQFKMFSTILTFKSLLAAALVLITSV